MPPKKVDKLTQLISTLPVNGETPAPTSNNGKGPKGSRILLRNAGKA